MSNSNTATDHMPKDAYEIHDYVRREGPISFRDLQLDTHWMAPDDIFDCLTALEKRGDVERLDGSLEEHGTTAEVWHVPYEHGTCDHAGCTNEAVALYEGVEEPDNAFRFKSCDDPDHAPDIDPIEVFDDE